jgi:hypothetical protein
LLQKQMASHAIRDLCGGLSKAQGFLDQPLVVGMALLHGGSSTCEEEVTTGRKEQLLRAAAGGLLAHGCHNISSSFHPRSNCERGRAVAANATALKLLHIFSVTKED